MKKKVLIIIGIVIAIVIAVTLYCIKRIPTETITLEEFQKNTQNCGYEYVDNCVTIPVEELGKVVLHTLRIRLELSLQSVYLIQ